jgi:hypothetical protein
MTGNAHNMLAAESRGDERTSLHRYVLLKSTGSRLGSDNWKLRQKLVAIQRQNAKLRKEANAANRHAPRPADKKLTVLVPAPAAQPPRMRLLVELNRLWSTVCDRCLGRPTAAPQP